MHSQFANMYDADIDRMMTQMQFMADNPAMMKMATDAMKHMTPEQMAQIQQGQIPTPNLHNGTGGATDGGGGTTTPPSTMDQAAQLLSNMTGKQVKEFLKMAKDNPELLQQSVPAGTDTTQMERVLTTLEGMDEATLDRILKVLTGIQKFMSPIIKAYTLANRAVGGHLFKMILVMVVALVMYRWMGWSGIPTTTTTTPALEDMVNEMMPPEEGEATTTAGEFDDEF
jgi:hypothetical protein